MTDKLAVVEQRDVHDRTKYIGSSDIAAIIGISPWRTAVDVWLEKRGEVEESFDAEREKRLRRGNRLEPIVIEMFQEEKGVFVEDRNTRWNHPEYSFLSAQIDFEYRTEDGDGGVGNGETKTVDPRAAYAWGPDGSQEIPDYYLAQVMFGLAVTGRKQATVAALIGDDLRCYVFERDDELCDELIRKAVQFWDVNVTMGISPAIQTKDDASKLIRRFSGLTFEAGDSLLCDVIDLRRAKAEAKAAADKVSQLEIEIQRSILVAAEAFGQKDEPMTKVTVMDGGRELLSWSLQKRAGYEVKPTEFMVMRLKGGKNE